MALDIAGFGGRRAPAGNPGRSNIGGGRFNSQTLGGFRRVNLARPTYAPMDTTGTDALKKRLADADRIAGDPLSAPGVQQQLATISEGLNRQFASAQGDAKSTAAQTGQAGLGGAFAQTAANLSGQLANTRAQTQSDVMLDVYNRARQEGLDANSALQQAQIESERIKSDRAKTEAELAAQEADLNQRAEDAWRRNILDQARLAEDARQYDESNSDSDERFGFSQFQYNQDREDRLNRERQDRRPPPQLQSFSGRNEDRGPAALGNLEGMGFGSRLRGIRLGSRGTARRRGNRPTSSTSNFQREEY